MTEQEWVRCTDPRPMLDFLRGKVSDRKLRLFACACCRRVAYLSAQPTYLDAIEQVERFTDGLAKQKVRIAAGKTAVEAVEDVANRHEVASCLTAELGNATTRTITRIAHNLGGSAAAAPGWAYRQKTPFYDSKHAEEHEQTVLFRCIFSSPFRRATLKSSWLTGVVTQLAEGIYGERAFDRMPILGDALEETGCDNQDILEHCRTATIHCSGCWVIDLLLKKVSG